MQLPSLLSSSLLVERQPELWGNRGHKQQTHQVGGAWVLRTPQNQVNAALLK